MSCHVLPLPASLTTKLYAGVCRVTVGNNTWWSRYFRFNRNLFDAVGVGTKAGIQRYDLDHVTQEDVAEGLADLCQDVINAYDDSIQFAKFMSTQLLILSGTIVATGRSAQDEQMVFALMWGSALCGWLIVMRSTSLEMNANDHFILYSYLVFHHKFLIVDLVRHAVNYSTPDWMDAGAASGRADHVGAQRAVFSGVPEAAGAEPSA